ncbi:MAG: type IV secretory system conjugative DNA transfer family protein [Tenericutes bacterium]|nr:type IV secretory system conjugative DNA transfer family protein [Mycoplasmatota bacterium]
MNLTYILILVVLGIFLLVFVYIEPMLAKHKIKNSNEYGSARFSSLKEIQKTFDKENVSHIKNVGFPIWFDKNLKTVWMDKETPHWVYLGSTGSGKSVTQVIPYCSFLSSAETKRSAFITDPKGEIFSTTSKMFKDRGYEVITIDFRNPEKSNKLNILEPIINEYEEYMYYDKIKDTDISYNNMAISHLAETNRLITSLSEMIMKEKVEAKDPFWNNSARQLLEGLIGFFLEEYKLGNINREQITMTSIRKFQNSSMAEKNFAKFKEYLETREYGTKSKDSLTSIITASENTYKSITSVWGSKMSLFDDVNVANVTSISDFDFGILGKRPTVLYVIVPDEDKTYFTLVTVIVGLLYRELVKVANSMEDKKLPIQIDFILDEFANCPPLSDIEAIVSVARSRGMRFHFFIQSFAQLDNVYGKDVAQIILDNCGLVYLKTNTQETAEAISKRLGKRTIEQSSVSQSISLTNYNGNKSTSLMARDLLTPEEVKQLHYKMIIFPIIGFPIFRDTILYKKFSCYQKGMIDRTVNGLKDLSYTYFTVENIKYEMKTRRGRFRDRLTKENQEMIEEKLENERNLFKEVEDILKEILINKQYKVDYDECNNRAFMKVNVDNLDNGTLLKVKNKIDNEKYHIENNKKDNNTIIEIHFKSAF